MAITLYGTGWCSDCKRSKQFLGEQRVHYDYVDVDADTEAGRAGRAVVQGHNGGKDVIPTIVFDDGGVLVGPSNAELGLQTAAMHPFYDLVVVGSGPPGLTAALYAAREGMSVLVVERGGVGGQAGVTERLDNFPGLPEGVTGAEFADRLRLRRWLIPRKPGCRIRRATRLRPICTPMPRRSSAWTRGALEDRRDIEWTSLITSVRSASATARADGGRLRAS